MADLATGKSHGLLSVDDQFAGISQDGNTIAVVPSRRQQIVFVTVNGQIVQRARWIHLDES